MKDRYIFPAIFQYEDKGGISVSFPDLPGCFTCGDTDEEAITMAQEAMGLYLCDMEEGEEPIPSPTQGNKIHLSENERIFLVDVWMPKARAAVKKVYVKKTLTIPSYLDAAAQKAGLNFSQVLSSALQQILSNRRQSQPLSA